MLKRSLVFVLLIISSMALADVAMITDLSGKVTATLEESSWEATLAEILPDGTHLKTAKESYVTLIHMVENKEYKIEAEAEVTVTAAGVTGENLSGKELTVVASSFDLGADSANQAGAAHIDRGMNKEDAFDRGPLVEPVPEAVPSPPAPKSVPRVVDIQKKSENVILREKSMILSADEDSEMAQVVTAPQIHKVSLALPASLVEKFTDESGILDIDNTEVKNFSGSDLIAGWMNVDVELKTSDSEMVLNLKGDKEILTVKVFCAQNVTGEISLAWKLEREEYLAQAAWIWISLRDQGKLPAEKAEVHLTRIREKMLK